MNSNEVLTELIRIRHGLDTLFQRDESRFLITPESSQPHVILWQSYTVEDVAKIAASCSGESHKERIVEALRLLEAAERIANPDPWENQHMQRQPDDCLGDISDFDRDQAMLDLEQVAPEIIKQATNVEGKIIRKELCKIACAKAGRVGKEGVTLSADRIEALFLEEWLPHAADSRARWAVFRQIQGEHQPPNETILIAIRNLRAAQAKCNDLSKCCQVLRDEKHAAHRRELSEAEAAEIEGRLSKAESRFRASKEVARNAEREVSLAWDNFYSDEVTRKRGTLTEGQKKQECEDFRLSFESGINTQPRIILDEMQARLILLGTTEFRGLLMFLKFPLQKLQRPITAPRPKDEFGHFTARPKADSGKFKKWGNDGSASEEYPTEGVPNDLAERTNTVRLRKKK